MVGWTGLIPLAALVLALGACKSERETDRGEVAAPKPSDAAPVEVAAAWWTESPPCPDGAAVRGAAPPDGSAIWCETAGGVKHGPYSAWREVGGELVPERRGAYVDGVEHGVWRTWTASGKPGEVATYARGKRDGDYRRLWPDGSVRVAGRYAGGVPDGDWRFLGPGGEVRGTTRFAGGNGVMRRYFPGGGLELEYHLAGGVLDGVWTSWDEAGRKTAAINYARGKREGGAIRWKDGVEIERGAYADDMKTGTWRERDASGEMVERTYERGREVPGG